MTIKLYIDAESTIGCVCPGDTLTYECTVTGGVATIWTGTAFECSFFNEIVLRHSRFPSVSVVSVFCNNGATVARSLSVEGNNYTSQLNVTVTLEKVGKTVECLRNNGTHDTLLISRVIPGLYFNCKLVKDLKQLITIGSFSPPNTLGIKNVELSRRQLTFTWSPVAPDCPAIYYNILASNCGSCPTTTNHTNVTCTDVPTDGSVCTFAVQTVACGNISGNFSNPISINVYPTDIITAVHPTDITAYIAAISSLATFSVVSITALLAVIVIILIRSRAKIKTALDRQATHTGVRSTQMESVYEDPIPSVSRINTQDNIAYGHTQKTTTQI